MSFLKAWCQTCYLYISFLLTVFLLVLKYSATVARQPNIVEDEGMCYSVTMVFWTGKAMEKND